MNGAVAMGLAPPVVALAGLLGAALGPVLIRLAEMLFDGIGLAVLGFGILYDKVRRQ